MSRKIIVTGATGLIGKKICESLLKQGNQIIVFTRSPKKAEKIFKDKVEYVKWDYDEKDNPKIVDAMQVADAIIHLAGENVMSKRWSDSHKDNVLKSRMLGTRSLVKAIEQADNKPGIFISASAVGYYGTSENDKFTEDSKPGKDFLANVTGLWEQEVKKVTALGLKEVRMRTGIVLDKGDGALAKMLMPFKLFIGGPLGSGKQWFPWIHVNDVVGIYLHALENESVSGPLNAVAPEAIDMNQFAKALGKVLHRPSLFRVPEFVLNIILGEGASAVLQGQNVIPQRTVESGYKFKYTNVEEALKDILG